MTDKCRDALNVMRNAGVAAKYTTTYHYESEGRVAVLSMYKWGGAPDADKIQPEDVDMDVMNAIFTWMRESCSSIRYFKFA